jgi:hypothetical protein
MVDRADASHLDQCAPAVHFRAAGTYLDTAPRLLHKPRPQDIRLTCVVGRE